MARGAENDPEFQGSVIGKSKMEAERAGKSQRTQFGVMVETIQAWRTAGISVAFDQVTWSDPVDQAAWSAYVRHYAEGEAPRPRRRFDPPEMKHEDAVVEEATLRAVR